MTESTKTLVFAGLAMGAVALAAGTRSGPVGVSAPEEVGKPLFAEFTDPLAAASMRIVRFDEGISSLQQIEIKKVDGLWSIPSHEGYPADAENQIRDACAPFANMNIVQVIDANTSDQETFGLLEPSPDKTAVGDQGVGTLVTIKNEAGENLVNLIIGKEVKDRPGLHYVRRPNQQRIYQVEINLDNLPTEFSDWIDKDLLGVNAWDISQLVLKDYSFQVAQTFSGLVEDYNQRSEMVLTDDNGTWKLDQLREAQGNQLVESQMADGEELDSAKLGELKRALDSLEIVDVERKPAGLGEDLRADKGFFADPTDSAGFESMFDRGFYPVQMGNDRVEILSTDGEVLCRTKEGVEYILRFGKVSGVDTAQEDGAQLNRFLLVSARVNMDQFPEPELEALPEEPATPATPESNETPGETDTAPTALLVQEEEGSEEQPPTDEPGADVVDEAAGEAEQTAEPTEVEAADETAEAEAVEEVVEEEATDADAESPVSDAEPAPVDETSTPTQEIDVQAERERITKENQRKIDERNDKIEAAETKVRELNYRFADWYYVISEDVYKQIHLSKADVVKKAESTEGGETSAEGIDAFRGLEQGLPEGLPAFQP